MGFGGTGGGTAGGGNAGGAAGGLADAGVSCVTDVMCGPSETCHPTLRQCIPACSGTVDCPDSAKSCATFSGAAPGGGARAFCQCSTDVLCDRGTPGQVCQPATKRCGARCQTALDCPGGASCEPTTGRCSGAVPDAGVPDGGTGPCVPGSCPTGVCDPTIQRCAAAAVCLAANPQPDTCAYGLVCSTSSVCGEAPRTTATACMNFATVSSPLRWDPATVSPRGPVTTAFGPRGSNDLPACASANPVAFTFTTDLYAPGTTPFPAALELVPSGTLNYVRTDGQIVSLGVGPVRPTSGYASGLSNNNRNLRLVWTVCAPTGTASLRAGFYALNGNAVCATAFP
jgi:hypothetical protein